MDGDVIVSVDRLTRWAGIQRVISALPALPSRYTMVVVGRGRARSMLEAHADYLGVADRVRFAGGVTDAVLHRLLRTASVVATLKEEDLWGGTLLSAACAGTPVVASDMPAHREAARLVGSEGISFVSRRASPLAVADAVTQLAATGEHPFAVLVPRWADLAEETMSIYREVLDDELDRAAPGATLIMECDVAAGIPTIAATAAVTHALVLVRVFSEPIGLLRASLPAEGLESDELHARSCATSSPSCASGSRSVG